MLKKREEKIWQNIRQAIEEKKFEKVKNVEKTVYIYARNWAKKNKKILEFSPWKYYE